ncbi:MAG: hypothetical protein OJF49_004638 [Ktedonobacterales bacterium]|nr:MAG: hypothetical protein OJF49_004638 [Ktedonobacterales bacterium]
MPDGGFLPICLVYVPRHFTAWAARPLRLVWDTEEEASHQARAPLCVTLTPLLPRSLLCRTHADERTRLCIAALLIGELSVAEREHLDIPYQDGHPLVDQIVQTAVYQTPCGLSSRRTSMHRPDACFEQTIR